METYYYFILPIVLLLLFFLFRSFFTGRKNIPGELFTQALKNENSGHFEEAVATYKNALQEVQKGHFHDTHLENMIVEKLRVLNTAIEYQKNFHCDRQLQGSKNGTGGILPA